MSIIRHDLQGAWTAYRKSGSLSARNELIEGYLPLVKSIAQRLHSRLPREVDVEDLMSDGVFGLVETIETFDLDRGVAFEAFASQRIKGAMIDRLRTLDWVPRLVRTRRHRIDDAFSQFETKFGRIPTDEEIAGELGMSAGDFYELARSATATRLTSLHRTSRRSMDMNPVSTMDRVADDRAEAPADCVQRQDVRDLVTRGLNRKERLIVLLYYYEEMTMKEVGVALGLSESRVSQMHTSLLLRIGKSLKNRDREFVV